MGLFGNKKREMKKGNDTLKDILIDKIANILFFIQIPFSLLFIYCFITSINRFPCNYIILENIYIVNYFLSKNIFC